MAGEDESEFLGIQDAAKALGVTMRTLRFYEDKELIAPKRVGTTRIYSRRELGRMQLILRGKRLGFTIREIRDFLDLYDADPQHQEQTRKLLAKVRERIKVLEDQRRELDQTLDELGTIEQQACDWLRDAAAGDGKPSEG